MQPELTDSRKRGSAWTVPRHLPRNHVGVDKEKPPRHRGGTVVSSLALRYPQEAVIRHVGVGVGSRNLTLVVYGRSADPISIAAARAGKFISRNGSAWSTDVAVTYSLGVIVDASDRTSGIDAPGKSTLAGLLARTPNVKLRNFAFGIA